MLASVSEHLADDTGTLSDILVDDGGGDDFEEVGVEGGGDGAGEEGLSRSGGTVEEDAFGWLDADPEEEFGV